MIFKKLISIIFVKFLHYQSTEILFGLLEKSILYDGFAKVKNVSVMVANLSEIIHSDF